MVVRVPRNKFEDPDYVPANPYVVVGFWICCGLFCLAVWGLAIYGLWRFLKG